MARALEENRAGVPAPGMRTWGAGTLLTPSFLFPAALIAVAVLVFYRLTWHSFEAFTLAIDHCEDPFCDFYRHYFPMAQEVFSSGEPVPGFYYSPFAAVLLGGFRGVSIDSALLIWGAVQVGLTLCLALIPCLFAPRSTGYALLHVLLVLTAVPVLHNFKWGQVSVLIVLSILVSVLAYRRGSTSWAALPLAFAISINFYPALFLAIFLLRRDVRFLLWCTGLTLCFLLAVPFGALGVDETLHFYQRVEESLGTARQAGMAADNNSQYFASVLVRVGSRVFGDLSPLGSLFRLLGWVVAGANLLFVRLTLRPGREEPLAWPLVLLFLTVPFVVGTSWPHYFVFLPFCQVFVWRQVAARYASSLERALMIGGLVVPSIVCSNITLFQLIGTRRTYAFYGMLLCSDVLLLTACYLVLAPALLPYLGGAGVSERAPEGARL